MRLGQQVAGLAEGRTALDNLPFSPRPFYRGNPWFYQLWLAGISGVIAGNASKRQTSK